MDAISDFLPQEITSIIITYAHPVLPTTIKHAILNTCFWFSIYDCNDEQILRIIKHNYQVDIVTRMYSEDIHLLKSIDDVDESVVMDTWWRIIPNDYIAFMRKVNRDPNVVIIGKGIVPLHLDSYTILSIGGIRFLVQPAYLQMEASDYAFLVTRESTNATQEFAIEQLTCPIYFSSGFFPVIQTSEMDHMIYR